MQILISENNVNFLPKPNNSYTVVSNTLPPLKLITAVFVLAFKDDSILLTNIRSRGWDIPGGHIETGESPEEAIQREVYEETGAILKTVELLGYMHLRILAPKPQGYSYPYPESYMILYWGTISGLEDFEENKEVIASGLFTPEEARQKASVQRIIDLYEIALKRSSKEAK